MQQSIPVWVNHRRHMLVIPFKTPWYLLYMAQSIGLIQSVWKAQTGTLLKTSENYRVNSCFWLKWIHQESYWMKQKKLAERLSAREENCAKPTKSFPTSRNCCGLLKKNSNRATKVEAKHTWWASEWSPGASTKRHWVWRQKELEMNSKYKSGIPCKYVTWIADPSQQCMILAKLLSENKANNLNDKQVEYARVIHKSGTDYWYWLTTFLISRKLKQERWNSSLKKWSWILWKDDIRSLFSLNSRKKTNWIWNWKAFEFTGTFCYRSGYVLSKLLRIFCPMPLNLLRTEGKVTLRIKQPDRSTRFTNPNLINSKHIIEFSVTDTGIEFRQRNSSWFLKHFNRRTVQPTGSLAEQALDYLSVKCWLQCLVEKIQLVSGTG